MENVLSYYIRSLCKVLLIAFISFLVGCIDASKHNFNLSVMELDDCKNIIIEEPYHNHRIHKISNNLDKRKILNILHKKSAYELCKVPPKIIITIEGKIHNEGYIICGATRASCCSCCSRRCWHCDRMLARRSPRHAS